MKSVTALPFVLILVISGCDSIQPEHNVTSIPLGTGSLEVRYLEILGPAAFAPHTVRFYYREKDKEQFLAETELANDGANLGEHNVEVADLGNGNWQIILKGQEQADEHWVVETAGGKVRMKKPEPAF
jgi:hypothetical protein